MKRFAKKLKSYIRRGTSESRKNSLVPPSSRTSNRTTSFSSTASEDSDVFVIKSASVSHSPRAVSSSNSCDVKSDTSNLELDMHYQSTEDLPIKPLSIKKPTTTCSPTPNTESVKEEQEGALTAAAYLNVDRKTKGLRPRTSALSSAAQRNYRTSSASSGGAHHRRCTAKTGSDTSTKPQDTNG